MSPPTTSPRCSKKLKDLQLRVLTMTDPITGWFEVALLKEEPSACEVQKLFDECWLALHPRPKETGFDNASEFKKEFLELCDSMDLKPKTSNS